MTPVRAVLAVLVVSLSARLSAQSAAQSPTLPARPALDSGADTNSFAAYVLWGSRHIRLDPIAAANAFYWASRIDPTAPVPLYARAVALLISDPYRLVKWADEDSRVMRSPEIHAIDSLRYRAMTLNPFLHTALDQVLMDRYLAALIGNQTGGNDDASDEVADMEREMQSIQDPNLRGWLATTHGDGPGAVAAYHEQVRRHRRDPEARADLAYGFVLSGRLDSARAELEESIALARAQDTTHVVPVYESKEMREFQLGYLCELTGDTTAARTAYQSALTENLAFSPAHVRLGMLAIVAADTATAIREFQAAVDVRDDDAYAQLLLGYMDAASHKLDDAITHLARASALEPFWPQPVGALGRVQQAAGRHADALATFQHFLAIAPADSPLREDISRRVAALTAPPAPSP